MSKLSDNFDNNNFEESIFDAFDAVEAAPELGLLPKGLYIAQVDRFQPNLNPVKGTPNYAVTFRIIEGSFTGRMLVFRAWLTENAMSYTKRDLGKIGIESKDDLKDRRFDAEAMFELDVGHRTNDNDETYNNIVRFWRYEGPQPAEASSVDTNSLDDEPSEPGEGSYANGKLFDESFGPGGYRHESD